MTLIHADEYNRAIAKLESAILECRFVKRTPEAYQRTADNIRQTADSLAGMLEREKEAVTDEE